MEKGFDVLGNFTYSKLFRAVQSAIQGREALGKRQDKVHVLDSNATVMAMEFQVLAKARAVADGASLTDSKAITKSPYAVPVK